MTSARVYLDDAGSAPVLPEVAALGEPPAGNPSSPHAEARRARELDALVHLDACQGPRWIAPPLEEVDLASFSGHKLGAGRGGLLYARPSLRLEPLLFGGPQEWARRAGREDVGGALAVATALDACRRQRAARSSAAAPLAGSIQRLLASLGGR